jgi:YjbE family integral membrane protein
MSLLNDPGSLSAFFQVIMIDLVLAGDNAIVIGLAAAGLPAEMRKKAVLFGIVAATMMRIVLAVIAVQLLAIVGLMFAGGLLLLWVCWKMWQELHDTHLLEQQAQETLEDVDTNADGTVGAPVKTKTFRHAITQIMVADISMSLDNVLAVAGAARDHTAALIFGLGFSIVLMGFAAAFIANLLNKHRWLGYVGLAVIFVVALRMIFHGAEEVLFAFNFHPTMPWS